MKCISCGSEIKAEYNNCPYCGNPIQIVPDYSIYDDDDINILLEGSKDVESKNNKAYIRAEQEKKRQEAFENKKKKQTKKTVIIVAGLCIILITLAILGSVFIDMRHASSYDYQMKQADKAMFNQNYDEAESFYLNALNLREGDAKAQLKLAELYVETEEFEDAIPLLEAVIQTEDSNYTAYKMLFNIYHSAGEVDKILALKKGVTDSKILGLFSDYIVAEPVVDLESGRYEDEITVNISAVKDMKIFYTLDGTDPITNGKYYFNEITIDEAGMHTVKAVAQNSYGVYSKVISVTYVISYKAPADPIVSPDSGDFIKETKISITVPDGCSAYYTWDGTDPTEQSTLYVSPIVIPEGKHILSVIIIDDKTGLVSGIYRGAFEYNPN